MVPLTFLVPLTYCSMDGSVQLHRLQETVHYTPREPDRMYLGRRLSVGEEASSSPTSPMASAPGAFPPPLQVGTHTQTFSCHVDRVKDIEVSAHEPSLFWSCSEDGTCRQLTWLA